MFQPYTAEDLLGDLTRRLAAHAEEIEAEAAKLSEAMADARTAAGRNEWNMARMRRSVTRLNDESAAI